MVKDRYELEEIVGSGGMGVVYRGRDTVLGRAVAVKMIRQELAGEEFIRRFEREAAILARLRSPYIVVVYDYGKHDDKFFMVTDFLTEGDLAGLAGAQRSDAGRGRGALDGEAGRGPRRCARR